MKYNVKRAETPVKGSAYKKRFKLGQHLIICIEGINFIFGSDNKELREIIPKLTSER